MPAVTVKTANAVCRITLNRPDKLNALSDEVRKDLLEAFEALRDDTETRIAVISGAGRCFSAGADLVGGALESGSKGWSRRRHTFGGWQRLLELIESVPQVTVASVHSHCIGGAALLAASCDLAHRVRRHKGEDPGAGDRHPFDMGRHPAANQRDRAPDGA